MCRGASLISSPSTAGAGDTNWLPFAPAGGRWQAKFDLNRKIELRTFLKIPMQPGKSHTGSGHQSKNDLFIALYYPPDQLIDELLRNPNGKYFYL
jgi:hypothetical protein